ncbi:hypothetical protein [Aromatoleum anaerobium]|uniref:Multidrug transporter n=1 Tax=Aromatoleum anaerobium TaxID=182180 RepID=A0ABX1PUL3_9RHOO|nr:hypothetical protein [Aromatoleum anaerobium]MCK0507072.1 hypothetical protein [Aromatoleum anaerobium]
MKKLFIASLAAGFLSWSSAPAFAQADDAVLGDRGSDMIVDLVLVRPLTFVGSVVGVAAFLVSLPFTAPSGSASDAARELVGKPLEYTFNRPLGDFRNCGADRHPCGGR